MKTNKHQCRYTSFVRESEDCMARPVRLFKCECGALSSWCYNSLWDDTEENIAQRAPKPAPKRPATTLNEFAAECHGANQKWWRDKDGNRLERNKGELLCLIHSEITEAMEGERKNLQDDKLPHRKMAEVELVDAMIRIFDYAGAFGYDLDGAYREKMALNAQREDHEHESREQAGGKKW